MGNSPPNTTPASLGNPETTARPAQASGSNDPDLVGTVWTLTALDGVSPIEDTAMTLEFQSRVLKGSSGCNFYGGGPDSGAYTAANGLFFMGMMAVTVQLCLEPVGIMEQEARYLDAFRAIRYYQVTASVLTLMDEDRTIRLVYVEGTP